MNKVSSYDTIREKILSVKNYCTLDKSVKIFLNQNYYGKTLGQQIYHFLNGNSLVYCPECGKECKWLSSKRSYSIYCSRKCYNNSTMAKENKKQLFMNKYGVDNPAKILSAKEKAKQTNLKKYGVTHHMKNNEIKENKKQLFMNKYGVDNPAKILSAKEKAKQTNLKKYGVTHHMKNNEIKENKKQLFMNKYGVDNPAKILSAKEKAKQTNLKKYGVTHHMKNNEIKEKVFNTNFTRYGVKSPIQNSEIYNKIANTNIDRYGYSHYAYRNINNETYNILTNKAAMKQEFNNFGGNFQNFAETHKLNISTLHKKTISMGLREPHKTGIISYLENRYKTYNIKLNCRRTIKPQELDMVFIDHNLALEINGIYWHSIEQGKNKDYHIGKINKANQRGIKLLMIWDFMWNDIAQQNKYIELIDLLLHNISISDYISKYYGNILPMDLFGWVEPYKYIIEPTISHYKNMTFWNSGYKVIE